ncbi:MAG: carboxypeptidase-like regulatory domain-containing protein [Chitinophagaceae bacterium]
MSGTVYDVTARRPLEAVAVQSTSGRGTITDSAGRYSLTILTKDSIWFSMIGKNTMKYPVDTISNTSGFDVMIHIKASELPEVKVRNRYYKFRFITKQKRLRQNFRV